MRFGKINNCSTHSVAGPCRKTVSLAAVVLLLKLLNVEYLRRERFQFYYIIANVFLVNLQSLCIKIFIILLYLLLTGFNLKCC